MECDSEIREKLRKLADQQDALIASVAAVKELICADQNRRKCLFILGGILESVASLKKSFPRCEESLSGISESLTGYVHFCFESVEDLHALYRCLDIVAGSLEDGAKDAASEEEFRAYLDLPWRALEELSILDEGIPRGWKRIFPPLDDVKEATRKEARERIEEMSNAWALKIFEREEEQRKKELYDLS